MIPYVAGFLLICAAAVVQTNLLGAIALWGARPDLLILLVTFIANKNGPGVGQATGFTSGLVQDLLSVSPLGFYSLTNTIIGYVYGFSRGNVFLDGVVFPMMLVGLATVLKGVLFVITAWIFGVDGVISVVLSSVFLIEIAYNALLAPIVYAILGRFRWLLLDWRERNY